MKSLQGQLLVASPQLMDPNFFRAVLLMVQHDENGAMGLVLNRPLDVTIRQAWQRLEESPCRADGSLHQGGPCEGPLMALHAVEPLGELRVIPGVFFSAGKDLLKRLVARKRDPVRFFIGYSGWQPGQLEGEIEEGAWLATDASPELVFSEGERLWTIVKRRIDRAKLYANLNPNVIPEDPSLN